MKALNEYFDTRNHAPSTDSQLLDSIWRPNVLPQLFSLKNSNSDENQIPFSYN